MNRLINRDVQLSIQWSLILVLAFSLAMLLFGCDGPSTTLSTDKIIIDDGPPFGSITEEPDPLTLDKSRGDDDDDDDNCYMRRCSLGEGMVDGFVSNVNGGRVCAWDARDAICFSTP